MKLKIVLHSSNGNLNQPLKEKFSSKFYCIKQEGCSHKERLLSGVSAFGINYSFKGFLILGWELFKVQFILKRSYSQGSLHCFADFFFLFHIWCFFFSSSSFHVPLSSWLPWSSPFTFFFELAIGSIMAWLCHPVTAGLVTETLYVGYVWHWIPPTFRNSWSWECYCSWLLPYFLMLKVCEHLCDCCYCSNCSSIFFLFCLSFSLVACLLISFHIWNLSLRNSEYYRRYFSPLTLLGASAIRRGEGFFHFCRGCHLVMCFC